MLNFLASLLFLPGLAAMQLAAEVRALPASAPAASVLTVSAPSPLTHFSAPVLSASGVILMDASSGEVVFSLHPDTPRPMASLTKLMTALILLECHQLQEIVTISPAALSVRGSKLYAKEGEQFTLETLLKAMLLPSANDIAYALAIHHSRNVNAFVAEMNARAKSLGLTRTHFTNPAGLDNEQQYASPRDLAWLTVAALKHPMLQHIVQTKSAVISDAGGKTYSLTNTNIVLRSKPNVFGVKTGTTDNAGECLIILFTEGRRSFVLVLLGSKQRYTDALSVMQAVHASLL